VLWYTWPCMSCNIQQ